LFFLGIDGGSTKTECMLADETGKVLSHIISSSCNYLQLGGQKPFELFFRDCIGSLLKKGGISADKITRAVIGIPAYGEVAETEKTIPEALGRILPADKLHIVNDAVVGWSGSLGAEPGINVVAGTGSIAFGRDSRGTERRVGGWSLFFDDEGSCSWIGLRAMSMFFKQSDGRLPKTPLYRIFREHYGLAKDIYFVELANRDLDKDHERFAKMQLLTKKACEEGDQSIVELYRQAAEKLADMVRTVRDNLSFSNRQPVPVSYSGGLFRSGEVILVPFNKYISDMGMRICTPRHSPIIGAIALAASSCISKEKLGRMLETAETALQLGT
jgi:N-acetylglucosamine kinase-like BadF-type ATPase